MNEKKVFIFAVLVFVFASSYALPPLEEKLPLALEEYSFAVYDTTYPQESLDELYEKSLLCAEEYSGQEKSTVLALTYFMRGMESYFKNDEKTAGKWFDIATESINAAISENQTALNTAYLAQITMQNAAVKGLSFQLKYVPPLPKVIDKALSMDPDCVQAIYMKNFFNCTVPVPYGKGYLTGAEDMKTLLESTRQKTQMQTFLMLNALGYAFSKKNRTEESRFYYEQALLIFKNNSETLQALKALKK